MLNLIVVVCLKSNNQKHSEKKNGTTKTVRWSSEHFWGEEELFQRVLVALLSLICQNSLSFMSSHWSLSIYRRQSGKISVWNLSMRHLMLGLSRDPAATVRIPSRWIIISWSRKSTTAGMLSVYTEKEKRLWTGAAVFSGPEFNTIPLWRCGKLWCGETDQCLTFLMGTTGARSRREETRRAASIPNQTGVEQDY